MGLEIYFDSWSKDKPDTACVGCGHYREDHNIGWICEYSTDRKDYALPKRHRTMDFYGNMVPEKPCKEKSKYPWTVGDFGKEEESPKPKKVDHFNNIPLNFKKTGGRAAIKVLCVETNEVFQSVNAAEKAKGLAYGAVRRCLDNPKRKARGFHWKRVED